MSESSLTIGELAVAGLCYKVHHEITLPWPCELLAEVGAATFPAPQGIVSYLPPTRSFALLKHESATKKLQKFGRASLFATCPLVTTWRRLVRLRHWLIG